MGLEADEREMSAEPQSAGGFHHGEDNILLAGVRAMIQLKRVYEASSSTDGVRFLIERLWPRGVKKTSLQMDGWLKEAAPSSELRKWFHHDPARWDEFRRRYVAELGKNPASWRPMLDAARKGNVTLLYSSHDAEHNNAVALQSFLTQKLHAEKNG
jgi:uncharacterized protein YeaO (DUF488 family)